MINKDTVVCISIAKNAGNFGTTIYNHVFSLLGMNYLYKSFSTDDPKSALLGARALGIRGISVTMPYKSEVLKYVDEKAPEVQFINAANTIVNDNGKLTAYNTDADSTKTVLSEIKDKKDLYILGSGGFSKAVQYSAKDMFENIHVVTRKDWEITSKIKTGTVFNCTPLKGLKNIFESTDVEFIDCDVSTESGKRMAVLQAARQFKLYTGKEFLTDYVIQNSDKIIKGSR